MRTLFLILFLSASVLAADMDKLLNAIEQVESRGDANAVGDSGLAIGAFQIHPIMVRDVNRFSKVKFVLADRLDREKSREICRLYLKHYASGKNFEVMAACWNSGPRGEQKLKTNKNVQNYVKKIQAELK